MSQYPLTLTIAPEHAGQPLARVLCAILGNAEAEQLMEHGGIWLNGRRVQDTAQLAEFGNEYLLHHPPGGTYTNLAIEEQDILYEDAWLLLLNKQAGWYVTPTQWDLHSNVQAVLTRFLQQRNSDSPIPHLAHQLDRDTSGVLLCSKNREVNRHLQESFDAGLVEKAYLCLCEGHIAEDSFEVRTGHGRKLGGWCTYPLDQVGVMLPNNKRIRFAHSHFSIVQRYSDATLLHATLLTGRTHQIRLHLAHIGHPLVGDTRYGSGDMFRDSNVPYHMLHAARLSLPHPVTGETLTIEAPLPQHMATLLGELANN